MTLTDNFSLWPKLKLVSTLNKAKLGRSFVAPLINFIIFKVVCVH